jgi:hypothetical protein
MADDINKKISIDIEINTDGQQQINQYKAAFDSLRNSINSTKNPLSNIAGDLKTLNKNVAAVAGSFDKLNNTTKSFNSTGSKIGGIVNTAIVSFIGLDKIFEELEITFAGFEAEVTAGLSLLVSFIPIIVDWVGSLFNADTTTKSLNQTLSEHKQVLQAVNQARSQGDQNAQGELVNLKLLYNASQNHNLSLKQRKEAVTALQTQYPGYFGNISAELILTGKATNAYNDLTKAIIANARAKAAEGMLQSNSERQIRDDAQVSDLKTQLAAKNKELKPAQKDHDDAQKLLDAAAPVAFAL